MFQQSSVPVRTRVGFPIPAALLLMVGTSIVTAGEIRLEAELQPVAESPLAPQPQPDAAAPAERDLLAGAMAPEPTVQRARRHCVIYGSPQREESGRPR